MRRPMWWARTATISAGEPRCDAERRVRAPGWSSTPGTAATPTSRRGGAARPRLRRGRAELRARRDLPESRSRTRPCGPIWPGCGGIVVRTPARRWVWATTGTATARCSWTSEGNVVDNDRALVLLARLLLRRREATSTLGNEVVYDIKCSSIVADEVRAAGGIPVMERSGHAFIKTTLIERQALFAGEVSGHFFFGELGGDDGLYATALMLQAVAEDGRGLAEMAAETAPVPDYTRPAPPGEPATDGRGAGAATGCILRRSGMRGEPAGRRTGGVARRMAAGAAIGDRAPADRPRRGARPGAIGGDPGGGSGEGAGVGKSSEFYVLSSEFYVLGPRWLGQCELLGFPGCRGHAYCLGKTIRRGHAPGGSARGRDPGGLPALRPVALHVDPSRDAPGYRGRSGFRSVGGITFAYPSPIDTVAASSRR